MEEVNSWVELKVGEEVDLHIVVPDLEVKNYTNEAPLTPTKKKTSTKTLTAGGGKGANRGLGRA